MHLDRPSDMGLGHGIGAPASSPMTLPLPLRRADLLESERFGRQGEKCAALGTAKARKRRGMRRAGIPDPGDFGYPTAALPVDLVEIRERLSSPAIEIPFPLANPALDFTFGLGSGGSAWVNQAPVGQTQAPLRDGKHRGFQGSPQHR